MAPGATSLASVRANTIFLVAVSGARTRTFGASSARACDTEGGWRPIQTALRDRKTGDAVRTFEQNGGSKEAFLERRQVLSCAGSKSRRLPIVQVDPRSGHGRLRPRADL